MAPPVCKFFMKNSCRFGDSCRFLHPGANEPIKPINVPTFSFKSAINVSLQQQQHQTSTSPFYSNSISGPFGRPVGDTIDVDMDGPPVTPALPSFSFRQAAQQTQQMISPQGANLFKSTIVQNTPSIFGGFAYNQGMTNSLSQPILQQGPFNHSLTVTNIVKGQSIEHASGSATKAKIYSLEHELTDAEIEAFRSNKFEFGHIPLAPPPQTLCVQ